MLADDSRKGTQMLRLKPLSVSRKENFQNINVKRATISTLKRGIARIVVSRKESQEKRQSCKLHHYHLLRINDCLSLTPEHLSTSQIICLNHLTLKILIHYQATFRMLQFSLPERNIQCLRIFLFPAFMKGQPGISSPGEYIAPLRKICAFCRIYRSKSW